MQVDPTSARSRYRAQFPDDYAQRGDLHVKNFRFTPNSVDTWQPRFMPSRANIRPWPAGQPPAVRDFSDFVNFTRILPGQGANQVQAQEQLLGGLSFPGLFRGQTTSGSWEADMLRTHEYFINTTFCPVVHLESSTDVVFPWMCVYTSQRLPTALCSYGGIVTPSFIEVNYTPQGTTDRFTINLQDNFLTGNDAYLAAAASITAGSAHDGCFIYFFPLVDDATFQQKANLSSRYWNVSGPSLGLAILAAILGAAPALYTGFISTINGQRLASGEGVDFSGPPLVDIVKQLNIIDNVSALPQKMVFAISAQWPLIMPHSNIMNQPLQRLVERSNNLSPTAWTSMAVARNSFAVSDIERGKRYADFPTPLLIAVDVNDAIILGALSFAVTLFPAAFAGSPPANLVERLATSQTNIANRYVNTEQAKRITAERRRQEIDQEAKALNIKKRAAARQIAERRASGRAVVRSRDRAAKVARKAQERTAIAARKADMTKKQWSETKPKFRAVRMLAGNLDTSGLRTLARQSRQSDAQIAALKRALGDASKARSVANGGPKRKPGGKRAAEDAAPSVAGMGAYAGGGAATIPLPGGDAAPGGGQAAGRFGRGWGRF